MRAAILCLLLSAVAISADLQSDIEDIYSHMPMKEIESIGKQYVAAYPSYGDGLRYVEEFTYEKLVKDFLQTMEGKQLISYFQRHGIDAESIFMTMAIKTTEMIHKWLEPAKEGDFVGPVISGDIMADYQKAVAASGVRDAAREKMETSPEFANLVAAVRNPEFKFLLYRGANSKGLVGYGKSAEVRGFWKKVWKVTKGVAVASAILG